MALFDDVSARLKDAMKARDADALRALRGIRAAFIEAMKLDNSASLTDEACLEVLRKQAKQRRESIEAYAAGGRDDLVGPEQAELTIIESFLPQLADEAQTEAWVREAVAATGATTMRDMGKVMGALMRDHRDEIDGKLANTVVRRLLA